MDRSACVKKTPFWSGFALGMGSTACVWNVNHYVYPHDSERDAMRSDWTRISTDISTSIEKADVKKAA